MYVNLIKPCLDRFFALILLILTWPIWLGVSLVLWVEFRGKSVLFKQKRPGKNGQIFMVYKFKTMTDAKDKQGVLRPDAERLTALGKIIRTLSLDELPQLFNILKGEMSFIGPRPLMPRYLPLYSPEQSHRHDVMPGLTGWAQVNGRNTISWQKKFELDLYYVHHISWMLDVKILLLTVMKVVKRADVNAKGQATVLPFDGTN